MSNRHTYSFLGLYAVWDKVAFSKPLHALKLLNFLASWYSIRHFCPAIRLLQGSIRHFQHSIQ
ncbi:hypothetical protein MHB42_05950 [Lysinibacillus sp. FSL K6-0232]|uniref:hypothetical protein n=1 Tax=Lysinibacillus sp. FSL K6-0232 TaxID=2921425 RepID=UPI0030F690CF